MATGWQAIFFDFDGVILDTTGVKTEAFAAMYREHGPEIESAVVAYHRHHGGISRMIKFRHFEEQILGRPLSEARLELLAAEFTRRTLAGVLAAPFIPGAEQTLREVRRLELLAFVVSGTPTAELRQVVEERQLGSFFEEVHGSPPLKPPIIQSLLANHGLDPRRCLFIGDALTDLDAAQQTGLHFCGVEPPGEQHPFSPDVRVLRDVRLPPAP